MSNADPTRRSPSHEPIYRRAYNLKKYKSNEGVREANWRGNLKHKYGITFEEYEQILSSQGGCCGGCKRTTPGRKRDIHWCIDHDHTKKKGDLGFIRGLLCYRCNLALGYLDDNLDQIIGLAVYKERSMGPLIKHLTPLSKHGQVIKHAGKGAKPFPSQPKPGALTQGAPSANNYAKATPLPSPPPSPMGGMGPPGPPMAGAMGAPPMGVGAGGAPGQDQGMV